MKRNPVTVGGLVGGILVAAAVGLTHVPHAAATTPQCQSSQLRPHFELQQGAAGHVYDTWQLINTGPQCEMRGWVNGLNFGPDGRPLHMLITRTGGPATVVVLAKGQHASWSFGYGEPGILDCRAENAVAMILTPPDNVNPVLASRGERACHGVIDSETPLVHGG